ncbi:Alpha/Beta hydrolase protein [Coprinopsis sp. MPI-PUGE-AT-0042]|nr:Alpha/Beta hydrolase protein [Coprinopsis sp. MPI-PUGE-AT-0042]
MSLRSNILSLLSVGLLVLTSLFPASTLGFSVSKYDQSPVLAPEIGDDCVSGARYSGRAVGKNVSIAGVPTYYTKPRHSKPGPKKVILFFSDIYGPFADNNFMLQDQYAGEGYHVLGIDYFFGDPIQNHDGEVGFNRTEWVNKSRQQATDSIPKWTEQVKKDVGSDAKFTAVGYCFGAPYSMDAAADDSFLATAFAHPSGVTEAHFSNAKKPVLLSCAETDGSFPWASQRRATDILVERKHRYHLQVFSGTSHGFATRADPADSNAVWAKEESARSVIGWFNRFTT